MELVNYISLSTKICMKRDKCTSLCYKQGLPYW